MSRCVIVGGAVIDDYDVIRGYLKPEDFYIICDCGLRHETGLGVKPDLVVGDFDSWEQPDVQNGAGVFVVAEEDALQEHLKIGTVYSDNNTSFDGVLGSKNRGTEVIVLPHRKDDTDTVFAVKEGIRRGFDEFLLLGMTGQRMDHTFANVYTLLMLEELGKRAMIVDDFSEMEIVGNKPVLIDSSFPYFSLISLAGTARHVDIEDAVFPLTDGEIRSDYQYAVSNEVLPGKIVRVSVGEGKLLLIRIRRDSDLRKAP